MLSLDLFKSKFETKLQEGAVDSVAEQTGGPKVPNQSYVANFNEFNTPENIAAVRDVWTRIQAHFMDEDSTWQWLTLKWPNHAEAVTLSPNQVFSILKKIASMSPQRQKVTLLTNFGNRNSFLSWLSGIKVTPRPLPKKDVPKGQQSFDLKEFKQTQKKSSDDLTGDTAKDVQVARELQKLRAMYPTASSDIEALVKDEFATQEKNEKTLKNLRGVNSRQDDLLKQIAAVNQKQDAELDDLDSNEKQLQQTVTQLRQANATLAQKLAAMSQRRSTAKATDVAPGEPITPALGVSVATDKQTPEPQAIATTTSTRDERLRRYAQRLRQQIQNLELKTTLQSPAGQDEIRQQIANLQKQLDQVTTAQATGQLSEPAISKDAGVGGKQADVLAKDKNLDNQYKDVEDFGIDQSISDYLKGFSSQSKGKPKKQKEPAIVDEQLNEGEIIPPKQVLQGYVVEFNPKTNVITISQRGQILKQIKLKLATRRGYEQMVNKFITSQEDEKYPSDIEDRDVRLPMRKIAEALPAKAAKELYRWMNQQNQPQAEPVATTAPAQPQPARLSDLQARHQKVEALFDLKKKIEAQKEKATAGGRILPRGLAADLEDYYSMDDIDTHYDQMLAAYQKQLKAIEQYLSMKKILNKKVTHEMRANELQETKESKAWEQGGREGYYHRPNKNPYKPGTQEHSDYNRGYEHFKGDKDWDVPKRRPVPEDTKSEFKAAALEKIKKLLNNPKLDPDVRKDYETRLKKIQDLEETKWKKETPWVKSTGKDPRGEVTHMSDVARKETERREREDSPMGQLFKDFEKVFGKKPSVKEGDVIRPDFRQGHSSEDYIAYKNTRGDYFDKIDRAAKAGDIETVKRLRVELKDLEDAASRRGLVK